MRDYSIGNACVIVGMLVKELIMHFYPCTSFYPIVKSSKLPRAVYLKQNCASMLNKNSALISTINLPGYF